MKEIVLKRFEKEAYKASYAWQCMQEAEESNKEAMRDSWREHTDARWLCWELLEAAGMSKDELYKIEINASGKAYDDYERNTKGGEGKS